VVLDGERGCGNGMPIAAGPLREPLRRLENVDGWSSTGSAVFRLKCCRRRAALRMRLEGDTFYDLRDPRRTVGPGNFADQTVRAVAAIGNPQRFFNSLRELGIAFAARAFPDHHAYTAADCASARIRRS